MDIKRRNVLAGSLGAAGTLGLPLRAGADGRLYGLPESISGERGEAAAARNLLRLPLARAQLPPAIWDELLIAGELWSRVLTDAGEAARFREAPAQYLREAGVDPGLLGANHSEIQVLRAIIDPAVVASTRSGDYRAFARAARRALDAFPEPSALKRRLVAYLREHREQIERRVALVIASARKAGETLPDSAEALRDVRRLQELVRMPLQGTGITEVNVLIDINFSVNFNVLSIVNALVLTFVLAGILVIGDLPAPVIQRMRTRLVNLDPELMRSFNQTVEVALLLGGDNFIVEAAKDLVDTETDAFLAALEEVGIVEIAPGERAEALALLQKMSHQRAGLAA